MRILRVSLLVLGIGMLSGLATFYWKSNPIHSASNVGAVAPAISETVAEETPDHQVQEVAPRPMPGAYSGNVPHEAPIALSGEKTVQFKNSAAMRDFIKGAQARGLTVVGQIPSLNAVRVSAPTEAGLARGLEGVQAGDVGPNLLVSVPTPPASNPVSQAALVPFNQGWIAAMGVVTPDPNWGRGVKVAVLDTGIESNQTFEGVPIQSVDFTTPSSATTGTPISHGTAVGSLIAGRDPQLSGLAPSSTLLSVKVLGSDGSGDSFTVAQGLIYAVDQGSQVINMSLGTSGDAPVLQAAVAYAVSHGVALVAAAGNEGVQAIDYPAQYPGVLAVGAVDATLQPASFSNTGSQLGVMAPGVGLPAGWGTNQVTSFSGTSAAAATVSGAVAAILSTDSSLTPLQGIDLLTKYADDMIVPGRDSVTGYGMVDIGRILQRNLPNITDGAVAAQFILGPVTAGQPISIGVTVQNRGTTPIWNALLNTQSAGSTFYFPISNLPPCQTVMQVVKIYPTQLVNGQAIVSSQLTINGVTDSNSSNNQLRSRLQVGQPTGN